MSTIKVDTIKNTSNVEVFTAKAWVNFDGTGSPSIRASGNVSSITDLGTGWYRLNFATAMPDVNYAVTTASNSGAAYASQFRQSSSTTTYVQLFNYYGSAQGGLDATALYAAVFR
jgi:hypothetical protein